jgi:hypothetical protein
MQQNEIIIEKNINNLSKKHIFNEKSIICKNI